MEKWIHWHFQPLDRCIGINSLQVVLYLWV